MCGVVCVCLCKLLCEGNVCGSCVCAKVWWWYVFSVVSGCLSVCLVVLSLVHVQSGVGIHGVCVCRCVPQHCVRDSKRDDKRDSEREKKRKRKRKQEQGKREKEREGERHRETERHMERFIERHSERQLERQREIERQ